jgi:hypothetical protein
MRTDRLHPRAPSARAIATVVLVASCGAVAGCDDDDTTPGSDPTGSLVGSVPGSDGITSGSSLPPQATPAPNPDAGGDGAPAPASTASP